MHKNWRRHECEDEDGMSEDALVVVVAIIAMALITMVSIWTL